MYKIPYFERNVQLIMLQYRFSSRLLSFWVIPKWNHGTPSPCENVRLLLSFPQRTYTMSQAISSKWVINLFRTAVLRIVHVAARGSFIYGMAPKLHVDLVVYIGTPVS